MANSYFNNGKWEPTKMKFRTLSRSLNKIQKYASKRKFQMYFHFHSTYFFIFLLHFQYTIILTSTNYLNSFFVMTVVLDKWVKLLWRLLFIFNREKKEWKIPSYHSRCYSRLLLTSWCLCPRLPQLRWKFPYDINDVLIKECWCHKNQLKTGLSSFVSCSLRCRFRCGVEGFDEVVFIKEKDPGLSPRKQVIRFS